MIRLWIVEMVDECRTVSEETQPAIELATIPPVLQTSIFSQEGNDYVMSKQIGGQLRYEEQTTAARGIRYERNARNWREACAL
mgnify:CR=1 FL=1